MKKKFIVTSIHPFVLKQEVSVYEDNKCIKSIMCNLDDIENTIETFVKEYDIDTINIQNKEYGTKIKDHLVSKYTDKSLNINIF